MFEQLGPRSGTAWADQIGVVKKVMMLCKISAVTTRTDIFSMKREIFD